MEASKTYVVTGMSCASCAISAESIIKTQKGVISASVNYANTSLQVKFTPDLITPLQLQQAVQSIGYDLIIDEANSQNLKAEIEVNNFQKLKNQVIWSSVLAVPTVLIGMFFMHLPFANWLMMTFSAPVIFWFGRHYFINAWKQTRNGSANMDTLVALSTGIAFIFSLFNTVYPQFWYARGLQPHVYYEASAIIIAFISLGKLMEEKAKSNTSSAIKKLMGLQPKTVRITDGFQEQEIPISKVQVGQVIIVKPGEQIAVDGEVVSGSTYINESMITGEAIPVLKEKNAKVFAGTINQNGAIHFKAEKVGGATLLAQIIKMVQDAQGSKAPVQKLVDKISGIFVPVVIGIAILTFIIWMVSGVDNALTHALLAAVTVLVIACPCALGLATPTAIMVGIGNGAEHNILIKDAESLELGYKVNAVILDKTGTITEGRPTVSDVQWKEGISEKEIEIFWGIENKSDHPLAKAIVAYLKQKESGETVFSQYENVPGKGIAAVFNGVNYYVGNPVWVKEKGLILPEVFRVNAEKWYNEAKTVSCFFDDKTLLGMVAIVDKIKVSSKEAIKKLQDQGIEVYMITGDNKFTAQAVARQVGLENFQGEALPSDKANFIKTLQQKGKIVAMVGDGINDSHALAQADVSIAMGRGSDIAMDVAKMTLITSDLNSIPNALQLSTLTIRTIKQNLFWAFFYNLIGIPIAAGLLYPFNGFLLSPMIAGAAMALSSVSVVANSLRLKLASLN